MKVRNDFRLSSLLTRLSLTTIVAGLFYAAIPSEHSDYVLLATAANQVARAFSRSASPTTELPQSLGPNNPRPALPGRTQKIRKWTGNLVDTDCVGKALRRVPSSDANLFPDPLSAFWQILEESQRGGSEHHSGAWSPQGQAERPNHAAWSMNNDRDPGDSERQIAVQRAQLKRAKMLENMARACTPSLPTMHYGLLVSDGELLKFDTAGDFKAKEAINISPVEPGMTVKVKVTGVIKAKDSVRVATIELKGRIPPPRASSGR